MGRAKRNLPAPVAGGAKERHRRVALKSQYDPTAPVPPGLVVKPARPKTKHHSYFEFVENKEKKKKLEFQVTTAKTPPPGFEFVPIGNPKLTNECKELSREKDAMIFIVSNSREVTETQLIHQVHRIGHHIRETIVEEARRTLGQTRNYRRQIPSHIPEPIPRSQAEYNAQVDAAMRDLFPRIPNTDRQQIIEHAFQRSTVYKPGEKKPVGLSEDITLARRVQLAVLAHIRHQHTRYDSLLRETNWNVARRAVEVLCLDTLVKWRGDEENGRDQLDEILREVVVISDSEDEMSGDESDDSSIAEITPAPITTIPIRTSGNVPLDQTGPGRLRSPRAAPIQNGPKSKGNVQKNKGKKAAKKNKKEKRGFKRYNAWQEAIERYREDRGPESQQNPAAQHPDPSNSQPARARTALPQTPMDFLDDFQPASEGAGPAPNETGYVRHAQAHLHRPMPSTGTYSLQSHQPMAEKVMTPAYRQSPTISSPRRFEGAPNPLQDMLVRSIEPISPNAMKPAFVRTVPPRGQGYGKYSPMHSNMQLSPRNQSPLRGPGSREEPLTGRRATEYFPSGAQAPGDYRNDKDYGTLAVPRERGHLSAVDSCSAPISPLYHPGTRPPEPNHISLLSPARPLYRDDPRPGDFSNPIIMEDRGGFYERVPSRPEAVRTYSGSVEVHRVVRDSQPQRIVSSGETSRMLRETQGRAGVQVIPITRGHPDPRPQFVPANNDMRHPASDGVIRVRTMDSGRRSPFEQRYRTPETRPVPGPMTPQYLSNGEVIYREHLPPTQYDGPMQRQYGEEPRVFEGRHDPRRIYPLRPHRLEDVIVLD